MKYIYGMFFVFSLLVSQHAQNSQSTSHPMCTRARTQFDQEIKKLEQERSQQLDTMPHLSPDQTREQFVIMAQDNLAKRAQNIAKQIEIVNKAKEQNLLKPYEIKLFDEDIESIKLCDAYLAKEVATLQAIDQFNDYYSQLEKNKQTENAHAQK